MLNALNVHKVKYLEKYLGTTKANSFIRRRLVFALQSVMHFYILELLFSAIFIYTCYNSIKKYFDGKVAVAIQESEITHVEYPSVRNSFKEKS